MPQSMQRQWPTPPAADVQSLYLWALEIAKLLKTGDIAAGGDLSAFLTPAAGDAAYVNVSGDTMTGNLTINQTASGNSSLKIIGGESGVGNPNVEIGRVDGTTSLPHFDFHSGATAVDFDARIIGSGGSGVDGGGTLAFNAASLLHGSNQIVAPASAAQGDIAYRDASAWVRLAAGASGQFLKTNGAAANPAWATNSAPVVAAAQATTSGTAFDFTGLPAEVSRIIVNFNGVSLSGTDDILVQIGDSGGIETSGYTAGGQAGNTVFTGGGAGYAIRSFVAANLFYGSMILAKLDTNTWVASYSGWTSQPLGQHGGGVKALSAGPLDRVRITRSGTNTFDAGSVNIVYD